MFDNYFSLSYSYMSFVAKDMIERGHPSLADNEFDFTPYNYLFNLRTSFTDGTACLHIDTLKEILDKFAEYGPEMLSILTYTRPISKEFRESNDGEDSDELIIEADSALHLALTNLHALNVDLILEKMSIANSDDQVKDASKHFRDIFHELVDYQNFKMYLTSIMNTTPEME